MEYIIFVLLRKCNKKQNKKHSHKYASIFFILGQNEKVNAF